MDGFSPIVTKWFLDRFGSPTDAQRLGWPAIQAGRNTLIAAPTGSGKTLAAFLASLDELVRLGLQNQLPDSVHTLYVSPLKALSNDVKRNLEVPLAELAQTAAAQGFELPPIRSAVRTGDTPASQRQAMLRRPPQILVTTPESLYLLLTSPKGRLILQGVKTVIVDEIHALARDKRGSHLTLSLERLDHELGRRAVRIGLSATQRPLDTIARFLVGAPPSNEPSEPDCHIVDVGHVRELDLGIETPRSELAAVCSLEQWSEVHERLIELIETHHSTIVFVNTRRMAERLGFHLSNVLGKDRVTSHHGSLSKEIRLDAEERLKSGELKAIVATASLELGIDVGYVDLVCQIGSPRSIATFLQRVGRSGHSLGALPKGRLFALTRDELLEALALLRAVRRGRLDTIDVPEKPLDILAQQIAATVAQAEWNEDDLFAMCRRAWPFRDLTREQFDAVLTLLSTPPKGVERGARLHRDRLNRRVRAAKGTRIIAATCGGAIPDNADYRVLTVSEGTFVGTVNEDFAIDSMAGDVFLLGNTSWRIHQVRSAEVLVEDAHGAPPTIPFWFGEAPGRTAELSHEVGDLRQQIADRVPIEPPIDLTLAEDWLRAETGASLLPIRQAVRYVAAQKIALGIVPTDTKIVFERFFDEMGGMQLVIHAPLGARINRGWGLAMRKRFCRSFDFELQASADDDGIVLSLGPQHSFALDQLFGMLHPQNARHMLEQAILDAPLFRVRWRWNVTRSLLALRQRGGKRVPPALQRFRADDLLTLAFPQSTACLENRPHDIEMPDHPIVYQTMEDCLFEATDVRRWIGVLERVKAGEIEFIPRDTREPSPFAHQLLNANPYAFLDDAPLEERRARAVTTRRTLSLDPTSDLSQLDPEVIERVRRDAWPAPRGPDEMHEMLFELRALPASIESLPGDTEHWEEWFRKLVHDGRAGVVEIAPKDGNANSRLWIAAESWPIIRSVYADATMTPAITLPAELESDPTPLEACTAIIRGWMPSIGPTTARALADFLALDEKQVDSSLELLEAEGCILRGKFHPDEGEHQWCDRRLLARIHRWTLDGVRRRIKPAPVEDYWRLALRHHGLSQPAQADDRWRKAPAELPDIVRRLAGFEAPAGSWEFDLFAARCPDYETNHLDELTLTGEVGWGRLQPPSGSSGDRKRLSGLTRVVPISIFPRADLAWLLPPDRAAAEAQARGDAIDVWEILRDKGALFLSDILARTRNMPGQVEQSLSELSALGLVTADGFAGIRSLVSSRKPSSSMARRRRALRSAGISRTQRLGGRWSLFPDMESPYQRDWVERAERWVELLIDRYVILFRDLLTRESSSPPWWQLVHVCRRFEAQGKLQGGRFIADVAAEQYAKPGTVDRLRQLRDEPDAEDWVILSAADPLNLAGIINEQDRVPATHGNTLAVRKGRVIAVRIAGEIRITGDLAGIDIERLHKELTMTGEARQHHARRPSINGPLEIPERKAFRKGTQGPGILGNRPRF